MGKVLYTAALVGCGRIGYSLGLDKKREQPASHSMALNANPRIKLIAGCDTDSLTLEKWHSANKKALAYSDSANLYARQKPDIITIAVNEKAHYKEAIDALSSHPKLVILEKPVALNLAEALKIKTSADNLQIPVIINHERRFAEDFILAKQYMKEIGDLQSIHAELNSSMCVYNPQEENTGAYSLIHDGTHLVDAVLFFLEPEFESSALIEKKVRVPQKKSGGLLSYAASLKTEPTDAAFETRYFNSILNNPVITGIFRDEKNCVRHLSAHYSTEKCPDISITMSGRAKFFGFEVTITGTLGRICIGNGYLKFYRRTQSELYSGFYSLASDKNVKFPKKTLYFANMVSNAVDFLDGKSKLRSTLQTGINALAVLEEIKNAIK